MRRATESSNPLPTGRAKQEAVRSMFDSIAPRYDLVNRIPNATACTSPTAVLAVPVIADPPGGSGCAGAPVLIDASLSEGFACGGGDLLDYRFLDEAGVPVTCFDDNGMALTIGITVVSIVLLGCTVGAMLPFLLIRVGLDPATSSTPFVATIIDVLGILFYFTVAQIVLSSVISAAAG